MKKRILALFVALVLAMTGVCATLPVSAAEPANDDAAVAAGYVCKIVSANGSVTYYKYYSPLDLDAEGANKFVKDADGNWPAKSECAAQSVQEGDVIVLLTDLKLGKNSAYGNPNDDARGKNVQGATCYIRSHSCAITIDGNGKSITSFGGFIASNHDVTVKNLNFTLTGSEGIGHARNKHTLTFENCNFSIFGIRPEDKGDGYFCFNAGKDATLVLKGCAVAMAQNMAPKLPLFFSNQTGSTLILEDTDVNYATFLSGKTPVPFSVSAAVNATADDFSLVMKGASKLTATANVLTAGGTVNVTLMDSSVISATGSISTALSLGKTASRVYVTDDATLDGGTPIAIDEKEGAATVILASSVGVKGFEAPKMVMSSIRTTGDTLGLRFTSTLSKESVAKAMTVGTMIVKKADLANADFVAEALAAAQIKFAGIEAKDGKTTDADGNVIFSTALTKLPSNSEAFAARSLAIYEAGGTATVTAYSAFDVEEHSCSIESLAKEIKADTRPAQSGGYRFEVTGGAFSRYTKEQYEKIVALVK